MNTQELFQAVQNSDIAIALGQAPIFFGILAQLFHISGLVLLLTSILLVNLRLLGVGFTWFSAPQLAQYTKPFIYTGLLFLILSGVFMLAPSAALYEPNPAFWIKLKLFAVALFIQFTLYRAVSTNENPNRVLAVTTAIVSLVLWFSVGLAGRAIGFVAA
ncbi:DUF6644 family protein [Cellvibrio fontiphilus]|uniref:DUF6644 family protein n=1 Tax=Cellvibrio fontiphilus TaxID=1815559 RepID=A0ABV7FCI1_9GAMM